jgi:DNA-binding transcriptional ArsR family regulator
MPSTTAFDAIADPSRRRIMDLLKEGERTAGQLAEKFTFSWPALSQHLAILKEAKLVSVRREGRFLWYSACPETLESECAAWINEYTAFWKAKLGDLKAYLEAESAPRKARRGRASSDDAVVE